MKSSRPLFLMLLAQIRHQREVYAQLPAEVLNYLERLAILPDDQIRDVDIYGFAVVCEQHDDELSVLNDTVPPPYRLLWLLIERARILDTYDYLEAQLRDMIAKGEHRRLTPPPWVVCHRCAAVDCECEDDDEPEDEGEDDEELN